jgi:transposase
VGSDRAAAAVVARLSGGAVARSPVGDRGDRLAVPHRVAVGGPTGQLRAGADRVEAAGPVESGRHLRSGCSRRCRPTPTSPQSWTGWSVWTPPASERISTPRGLATTRPPTQGARSNDKNSAGPRVDQALGRSRGGLTCKVHLSVDGRGLPLSMLLTPGQAGDNPQLLPLLDAIRVPRRGPGRPRRRPRHLTADKAYSHPSTRRALRRRGIPHSIPERRDQIERRRGRGSRGGRPPAFDAEIYKRRNVVERCFNGSSSGAGSPAATTSSPGTTEAACCSPHSPCGPEPDPGDTP